MNRKHKETVDNIMWVVFIIILFPLVALYFISDAIYKAMEYLFENVINPLHNKVCKIIRKPIPNSVVSVKGVDDTHFKRINDKLLTVKEAKVLGKEYEDKGYEVYLYLSEF